MRGRLVVLEGGEACGKSTQAALLAPRLGAELTREPGGTVMGERIRALLLEPEPEPEPESEVGAGLDARAEALLMAAARAQHVAQVLAPALDGGRHVVCDRFIGSSLAYQGFGRGLPLKDLVALSAFATAGLDADLVVLLDLPPDEATARRDAVPDRLEAAGAAFHQRVREGFAALAAGDPARWVVVDATGSVEEVAERVWDAVSKRLCQSPGDP